jgi:hypothetical protein
MGGSVETLGEDAESGGVFEPEEERRVLGYVRWSHCVCPTGGPLRSLHL